MQAIWSGNLVFGTILVPVRMYSASEELRVPFHMVHAEDGGRVKYKKVCEVDGKELHMSDIHKGYQVGDKMLQFTDEDLDELKPVLSKSLKILGFCEPDEVPMIALERPFYLGTESRKKGVAQPFALIKKAMEKSGKVAIVSWVTRASEQIGMMLPYEKGFLVKAILYKQQLRPFDQVEVQQAEVTEELVEKGQMLIERMTFKFDHASYKESYTEALKEIIEAKAMGKEVKAEPVVKSAETRSLEAELERMLV
jgi:DNA end-binding protein Ku